MFVLALLVEPACLLYSRAVMQAAAAEGARALATSTGSRGASRESCEAFVKRRLAAIPDLAIFHVGGEDDWDVVMEGGEGEAASAVEIAGHVRPLPLLAVAMTALGQTDGEGVVVRVRVDETVRPSWLEGGYADWTSIWDA